MHAQGLKRRLGPHRLEKSQKYHSKVGKSLTFQKKCMVLLVRTSPIETGRSRHAYRGGEPRYGPDGGAGDD